MIEIFLSESTLPANEAGIVATVAGLLLVVAWLRYLYR
jgi:hypothetical protein